MLDTTNEAPAASDLQSIAVIPAVSQRFLDLFDAAEALGYSMLCLFEVSTPGAVDALITWAGMRGLSVVTRSITPPGSPTVYISGVSAHRGDGKLSASIDVHHLGLVVS